MPETKIKVTIDQVQRFTLDSHFLIEKADNDIVSAIDQICGLNSQTARAPYVSLWSRIEGFKRSQYDKALYQDRRLIKTWLMRGTVHTVPIDDFAIYQKALQRNLYENWKKALDKRGLMKVNKRRMRFEREIVKVLAGGSFTKKELLEKVKRFLKGYRDREQKIILSRSLRSLAYQGLICHGEPTGSWYHFKENRFTAVKGWSSKVDPERIDEDEARQGLLIKYLKGYGPATINDFAYWSGLSVAESKMVFDGLKMELIRVEVDGVKGDFWIHVGDKRRLKIFKKGKLNTIFLPEFDPLIMGHKDKVRILDAKYKKKVFLRLADVAPVVMVNGRIMGVWNYKVSDRSFNISTFERIDKKTKGEIEKRSKTLKQFFESI